MKAEKALPPFNSDIINELQWTLWVTVALWSIIQIMMHVLNIEKALMM